MVLQLLHIMALEQKAMVGGANVWLATITTAWNNVFVLHLSTN